MTTTIRELLETVAHELSHTAHGPNLPPAAAATLGHCARALTELSYEGVPGFGARRMHTTVNELAAACQHAATLWPNDRGRPEALAGATADAVARIAASLTPGERWALAVSITDITRSCLDHVRSFPPCRHVPELLAVDQAAAALGQAAAQYPPTDLGRVVLDRSVPSPRPLESKYGVSAAADAAPALAAAVHAQVARGALTLAEQLATVAAAETAAQHAVALARTDTATNPKAAWTTTPAGWYAVHLACAPFDDGTKARPTSISEVIVWAASLEANLHDHAEDPSRSATALRGIANQLPEIAQHLERAVDRWARTNHLLARERRLASYEDHNLDAGVASDRVTFARGSDLDDLAAAIRDAAELTRNLASELDRTSDRLGRQPHPSLAISHITANRVAGDRVLHIRAERARNRAAATAGSRPWSFAPRRPRPG